MENIHAKLFDLRTFSLENSKIPYDYFQSFFKECWNADNSDLYWDVFHCTQTQLVEADQCLVSILSLLSKRN